MAFLPFAHSHQPLWPLGITVLHTLSFRGSRGPLVSQRPVCRHMTQAEGGGDGGEGGRGGGEGLGGEGEGLGGDGDGDGGDGGAGGGNGGGGEGLGGEGAHVQLVTEFLPSEHFGGAR